MPGGPPRDCSSALTLWRENPQAFATVKAVLQGVEHGGTAAAVDEGIADWARTFDRMAQASPEGSVALYALGNPGLLRAATDEVVARMREWRLLGRDRAVLEIGCGIGRFVAALAPECESVLGLDISEAHDRTSPPALRGLPNVTLVRSSGRDLAAAADATIDLVLAADVFPYLVQTGVELVDRHFDEAARVLKPAGSPVDPQLLLSGRPQAGPQRHRRARGAAWLRAAPLRLPGLHPLGRRHLPAPAAVSCVYRAPDPSGRICP